VALDHDPEAVRPFVERAAPTHPSLIDASFALAELYAIVNVPTLTWIDEAGRMLRPHDVAFGTDTFKAFTGFESQPFLDAVRRWVREDDPRFDPAAARERLMTPSRQEQEARAEAAQPWHLSDAGRAEAAERHFLRAGALSPWDFTIRRGSMPRRGMNPFGPDFFALAEEWAAAGKPVYRARPPQD
jgi:hypothetical protein